MKESSRRIKRIKWCLFLCTIAFLFNTQSVYSQIKLDKSAEISLLTVYPKDKAVYAIFGHTAIRVKSESQNIDIVYNYGYFDSTKPNFIYHFIKGETDYVLGIEDFSFFIYKYATDESQVKEQVLQLTIEEKQTIFDHLNHNALPENKGYRYDYFFDNCTTRPRDIIEKIIHGKIVYPELKEKTTLRDLVHECTSPYPWLRFGIDLVIGSGADSTIQMRTTMFLPLKLMQALDESTVYKDTIVYSPVIKRHTLLSGEKGNIETRNWANSLSPEVGAVVLFLLVSGITYWSYKKKRLLRGIDMLLFSAAGITGCIVAFICFISIHPCTSSNYNVIWLHPFHLIAVLCFPINSLKKFINWYHLINFAVLSIFSILWFVLPQEIPGAALVMAICLWLRSGYNLLFIKDKKHC